MISAFLSAPAEYQATESTDGPDLPSAFAHKRFYRHVTPTRDPRRRKRLRFHSGKLSYDGEQGTSPLAAGKRYLLDGACSSYPGDGQSNVKRLFSGSGLS